jgi:hypothetical protein
LHRRPALDPAARSEFLDRRFSNPIPPGRGLSILILCLTGQLTIRTFGKKSSNRAQQQRCVRGLRRDRE